MLKPFPSKKINKHTVFWKIDLQSIFEYGNWYLCQFNFLIKPNYVYTFMNFKAIYISVFYLILKKNVITTSFKSSFSCSYLKTFFFFFFFSIFKTTKSVICFFISLIFLINNSLLILLLNYPFFYTYYWHSTNVAKLGKIRSWLLSCIKVWPTSRKRKKYTFYLDFPAMWNILR